ncbi:hypothetical protein ACEZ3G_02145 [Maribacter algicola]|uniref:Uncharacterized protein n=1 Tax=Meishania litoralis TaxID=3434685 RepID=A0ACC7LL04_9FLAO
MKKIFSALMIFGACSLGVAQYAGQASTTMSAGGGQGATGQIYDLMGPISERSAKTAERYVDFQGSPYVSNTFLPTTMYYGNENVGKIFYRHNALNDEIEIRQTTSDEEPLKSLSRDKEVSILVDGKRLSFRTFVTSKKKTLNGYLLNLMDGETYKLYKRTHVKFTEGKPAPNSFVKAVPNRFSQFTEYYLQKEGVNRIDEISQKNSKLLKLVEGPKKEELKNYLKENKLNIKNEADLVKAVQFLNQ